MNNIDKEMMRESQAKDDNESKSPVLFAEININFLVEDNDMLVNGVVVSKRIKGDKHGGGEDE